jgi:tetratricopeptide (TPR) repeat protein
VLLDRKRVKFWQKWVFLFMAIVMAGFLVMIPITRASGCSGGTSSVTKQLNADITKYRAQVASDATNVTAWIALGDAYQSRANAQTAGSTAQKNDFASAVVAYTKATALLEKQKTAAAKQQLLDTYQKLVAVDGTLKDYAAAAKVYAQVTLLTPKDAQAFSNWGSLSTLAGDTSTALLAFTRYLQLAPNAPDAAAVRDWIKQHSPSASSAPTPKPSSTKGN